MTDYFLGKKRFGKDIAACIESFVARSPDEFLAYHEPFFGMGHVAVHLLPLLPQHLAVYASDLNAPVMRFWQALQDGTLTLPEELTHDQVVRLRDTRDRATPLHVLAGFACSFMGRYFDGIRPERYARNRASLLRAMAVLCPRAEFYAADFFSLRPPTHSIVYLDPPYRTASAHTLSRFGLCDNFDSAGFWERAQEWADPALHNLVFVSERDAPRGWTCVWERKYSIQQNGWKNQGVHERLERLFTHF